MEYQKRKFSHRERYAIWLCNEKRCWLCQEPLRLGEVTIDHVLPESLLHDGVRRQEIFSEYGLSDDFNINSYENWLPCHNRCNQSKGRKTVKYVPGIQLILDGLRKRASKTKRVAEEVSKDISKDLVLTTIFSALDSRKISMHDLDELLTAFVKDPISAGVPEDVIILDDGYWVHKDQIAFQGNCKCERDACVGHNNKVYCYFPSSLSPWIQKKGLFWRCYDEVISCPRCKDQHKRGHIGRNGVCGRPYTNQETQKD